MTTENSTQEIRKALDELCKHRLFAGSSIYTRLLRYLVEKSLAGKELKELTIGTELFGNDYAQGSKEGNVRSYMYKLRKKLSTYYEETDGHSLIFEIPKGQYNVLFINAKTYRQHHSKSEASINLSLRTLKRIGIVTVLVALLIVAGFNYLHRPVWFWQPFVQNPTPALLVISDQFVVHEINKQGEMHAILYPEVNNNSELIAFSQQHPEKQLLTADYTLMSKMAPFSTQLLSQWFSKHRRTFTIKLESQLSYDDVRNNNVLFVGQFKTMNLSKSLFLKNSKVFSIWLDGFKFKTDSTEKIYNTHFNPNGNIEYAMVSYATTAEGKHALYFVSNNDIGVIATVRNFTNPAWLKTFRQQFPKAGSSFNALFEVSGIRRNDVNCRLVQLEILPDNN